MKGKGGKWKKGQEKVLTVMEISYFKPCNLLLVRLAAGPWPRAPVLGYQVLGLGSQSLLTSLHCGLTVSAMSVFFAKADIFCHLGLRFNSQTHFPNGKLKTPAYYLQKSYSGENLN